MNENLVGVGGPWTCKETAQANSFLGTEILDAGKVKALVRSIRGGAWGKSKIELGGVAAVLDRYGSGMRRANEENTSAADEEEGKMEDLSKFEQRRREYVTNPGTNSSLIAFPLPRD